MELIPISETRNYVQRVIEGIYMYRMLIDDNRNLTTCIKTTKIILIHYYIKVIHLIKML